MPFYIKRKNGKWEEIEKELPISRRPSNKMIAVLAVSEKNPSEIRIKSVDQESVIIRFGPGFKHVVMHEAIIKQQDFIIHDQETNIMIVIIFSSSSMVFSDDTDRKIVLK
jgi:hypothetical protein